MNIYKIVKSCRIGFSEKFKDHYGGIYEGESNYRVAHGKGIYTYNVYSGNFKDGRFHGLGTMKLLNGIQFTGTFYFGNITGYGEKPTFRGTYKGNFINFKKKWSWKIYMEKWILV